MLNRIRRTRISSESTIQPDTTSHRDRFGLSFRTKIQLYFVASILALAAVTTVVAVWTGRSEIRRAIENDFARAPAQISGQLQSTFESFQQDVETSAGDPLYKAWLGRASAADALDGRVSASDLKAAHDGLPPTAPARWSEFRVTNDAGIVLVDARQQDAFGEDLSRDPLVARALSGGRRPGWAARL